VNSQPTIAAVDLFCGVGGLTRGLSNVGINVKMGVDLDPSCKFPIEENNNTKFLLGDVSKLNAESINNELSGADITLMAGCAPCQPFSTYSQPKWNKAPHKDWALLNSFAGLVMKVQPTLVTMENVPPLEKQSIFKDFVDNLQSNDYHIAYRVVSGEEIGLPQKRKRLVLVASKLGDINLPKKDIPRVTVREAIADLNPIKAGSFDKSDPLHTSANLSPLNLKRIKHSKPGGTWRDWPENLIAKCHTKKSGSTFPSVYGRMEWDKVAPTMTTQCFGFGNGRFGHPEQDRAISLREAAILQGFPREYSFVPNGQPVNFGVLGKLIGNAVPVHLGEYIGNVLVEHIQGI